MTRRPEPDPRDRVPDELMRGLRAALPRACDEPKAGGPGVRRVEGWRIDPEPGHGLYVLTGEGRRRGYVLRCMPERRLVYTTESWHVLGESAEGLGYAHTEGDLMWIEDMCRGMRAAVAAWRDPDGGRR